MSRPFSGALRVALVAVFAIVISLVASPAMAGTNPQPDLSLSLPAGTSPWDVKEGPDGRLYVSDSANSRILVYPLDATATTEPEGVLHVKAASLLPIQSIGLAFAPDNRLFVTSGTDGVVYFFEASDVIGVTGEHDIVASSTSFVLNGTVLSVTFHGNYMYAFAYDIDTIYVYDMTSLGLYMFVQSTTGLKNPTAGVVIDDQLVISNNHGFVDGSGMLSWLPLSQIEGHGQVGAAPTLNIPATKTVDSLASLSNFTDYLALDCNNNIVVTNYGGYPQPINVNKFSPEATQNSAPIASITSDNIELATAEGVEVDSRDRVWIAQTNGAVLRFDSFADRCERALPNTGFDSMTVSTWASMGVLLAAVGLGVARMSRARRLRQA